MLWSTSYQVFFLLKFITSLLPQNFGLHIPHNNLDWTFLVQNIDLGQAIELPNSTQDFIPETTVPTVTNNIIAQAAHPFDPLNIIHNDIQQHASKTDHLLVAPLPSATTTDHRATSVSGTLFAGSSAASTLDTISPLSHHGYTSAMGIDLGGRFLCPVLGCTAIYKRRDSLKNHFKRKNSDSTERVACPEPDCRKTFGLLPELKRHCAEVHGKGARYCPCLKRWFARRGHLIDRCPHRENCSGAVDRRRRTTV